MMYILYIALALLFLLSPVAAGVTGTLWVLGRKRCRKMEKRILELEEDNKVLEERLVERSRTTGMTGKRPKAEEITTGKRPDGEERRRHRRRRRRKGGGTGHGKDVEPEQTTCHGTEG